MSPITTDPDALDGYASGLTKARSALDDATGSVRKALQHLADRSGPPYRVVSTVPAQAQDLLAGQEDVADRMRKLATTHREVDAVARAALALAGTATAGFGAPADANPFPSPTPDEEFAGDEELRVEAEAAADRIAAIDGDSFDQLSDEEVAQVQADLATIDAYLASFPEPRVPASPEVFAKAAAARQDAANELLADVQPATLTRITTNLVAHGNPHGEVDPAAVESLDQLGNWTSLALEGRPEEAAAYAEGILYSGGVIDDATGTLAGLAGSAAPGTSTLSVAIWETWRDQGWPQNGIHFQWAGVIERLSGSHGYSGLSEVLLASATQRPELREIVIADVLDPEHPWGGQIPTGSELLEGSGGVVLRPETTAELVRGHFTRPAGYVDGEPTDLTQSQVRHLMDAAGGDVAPEVALALVDAVSPSLPSIVASAPPSVDRDELSGTDREWFDRIDGYVASVSDHPEALERLVLNSEVLRRLRIDGALAQGPGVGDLEVFNTQYGRWIHLVETSARRAGTTQENWTGLFRAAGLGAGVFFTWAGSAATGPFAPLVLAGGSYATSEFLATAEGDLSDVHEDGRELPVSATRDVAHAITFDVLLANDDWAELIEYPSTGITNEAELRKTVHAALTGEGDTATNAIEDLKQFVGHQVEPVKDLFVV